MIDLIFALALEFLLVSGSGVSARFVHDCHQIEKTWLMDPVKLITDVAGVKMMLKRAQKFWSAVAEEVGF